jgi:hypothetical protein
MKLSALISFNALLFMASGIAFAVYGPVMMAFFDVPELNIDSFVYWHLTAFGRMFGAVLFSLGLLLWALRQAADSLPPETRRGVIFALLLGNLLTFVVAITQQSSVWLNLAGTLLSVVFAALTLAYGYFLVVKSPHPKQD